MGSMIVPGWLVSESVTATLIVAGIQAEFNAQAQETVTEVSNKATKTVKETADKAS